MSRSIHVNLPQNITDNDARLFQPFVNYELDDLEVLYLHEVFVSYSGLCVDVSGVRPESHHNYGDMRERFLNDAVVHFKQALESPDILIELDDDEVYLLIHHPWASNYWHWMSECILRVWMIRENAQNMILILPESFRNTVFVQQSLEKFAFKKVFYIPPGKHLLVRNLCVPELKPVADSYYPETLHAIREHYLRQARISHSTANKRIYVSRKRSAKRKVINESEVEQLLCKYDFKCVCNEDFDFNEQVGLYSNAEYIVSIHGAGLTNIMFMKPGSSVLELYKKRTNSYDWHSFAFWYMADALGFRYHQQQCDPANVMSTFFDADFIVNTELLERNIQIMLK